MTTSEKQPFRPHVLVAEDNDSNFRYIEAIIGKRCDISRAMDGIEALELYETHGSNIAAILMDIGMSRMDGLEATRQLRAKGATQPIIIQTAYAFSSDRESAMESGATEVLVKPIMIDGLRNSLSKYLPEIVW